MLAARDTGASGTSAHLYQVSLALILIASICFYTEETMFLYLAMSGIGIATIFLKNALEVLQRREFQIEPCVCWLTVIYALFTAYGILFLKYGEYNWDAMLFNCLSGIAVYLSARNLLQAGDEGVRFFRVLVIVSICVIIVAIARERTSLFSGVRLGDTLSGNVNTVGRSLGTLSLFLSYWAVRSKSKGTLCVLLLVCLASLLTGSKGVLVFFAADLLIMQRLAKNKAFANAMIAGAILLSTFLVFETPQLYKVLGSRIEDALFQVLGVGRGHYSWSTDARGGMIAEGLEAFFDHPLFGGGEKYFASISSFGYGYSHCNYVELLCNYGLAGLVLFYGPILWTAFKIVTCRWMEREFKLLTAAVLLAFLVADWSTVTYSSIVMAYFPALFIFALSRAGVGSVPCETTSKSGAIAHILHVKRIG